MGLNECCYTSFCVPVTAWNSVILSNRILADLFFEKLMTSKKIPKSAHFTQFTITHYYIRHVRALKLPVNP